MPLLNEDTTMKKLNDTHLVLLAAAAQREDGSLVPPPETLSAPPTRIAAAIRALIKAGYAGESTVTDPALAFRSEGDCHLGVIITDNGRTAIRLRNAGDKDEPPAAPAQPELQPKETKAGIVVSLLKREQGATLDELATATKWLPHTTRAALTGLRKKGHNIDKRKRGDTTCYHLGAAA